MQMTSARITVAIVVFFFALSIASTALAQERCMTGLTGGTFCPLANVEGSKLQTLFQSANGLGGLVSTIFTLSISAGAIFAVLRLSWAGYLYMTSDSWGSKGHAKEVIGDVVLGLLLLLGIWLILYQINPDILRVDFLNGLKQINTAPTPATGYM